MTGISQVDRDSDIIPSCSCRSGRGRDQQRNNAFCQYFWEKAAPLPFALKPDNSVPSYMYLAPFILLPKPWSSEQVNPSGSKFRHSCRNVCNSSHLHLTQPQSPLVSTARSCINLFSWHWSTGLGSLVSVEICCISRGTSTAEYPS